jgi:hypothetical protein
MPTKTARKGAQKDKRAGKKPTTQAGNYVKQEMRRLKKGGSKKPKNRKQAIAIGLSEARADGVKVGKKKGGGGGRKSSKKK